MSELEHLLEQHYDNYYYCLKTNIENNTNLLVKEDFLSLFDKPPLDSMDVIRKKIFDVAKKDGIILDLEKIDLFLDDYRTFMTKMEPDLIDFRIHHLTNILDKNISKKDVFHFKKKDFSNLNRQLKKMIQEHYEKILPIILTTIPSLSKNQSLFSDTSLKDFHQYFSKTYIKQLLQSVEIRILVKDTILINVVKEEGERYLFTLENSRLLKGDIEN